ncbi:MAG: hypothetical protein ACE5HW_02795 [Candidatus Methanofastidiosia archaeon]
MDLSGNSYVTWFGYDGNDREIYFTLNIVVDSTGPQTSNTSVSQDPTNCATSVTLTATVDDSTTGNSNIQAAEYFIDTVGTDGTGTSMNAQDGAFDSLTENVVATIDVTGLSAGNHTLYVHGQDVLGNWGSYQTITFMLNCTKRRVNINETLKPLASNRISDAKNLLEKVQSTCTELKNREDPKFDECCSGKIDEVIEFLKLAEKFYASGNYIAASNYALKAIEILKEIIKCCEG